MAKKPKQKTLPGTEDKKHQDIIEAADLYEELRDKRQQTLEEEIVAKKELIELMKKHDLTEYCYNGKKIEFTADIKEVIKVRTVKHEEGGDE